MTALWRLGRRVIVDEVLAELDEEPPRDYRTIQTLLARCVEKGWAKRDTLKGRAYYSPKVDWERAIKERADEFFEEICRDEERSLEIVKELLESRLGGGRRGRRLKRPLPSGHGGKRSRSRKRLAS